MFMPLFIMLISVGMSREAGPKFWLNQYRFCFAARMITNCADDRGQAFECRFRIDVQRAQVIERVRRHRFSAMLRHDDLKISTLRRGHRCFNALESRL